MASDNDYIYHYTKFSTAVKYILPNRQLLLNSMTNSNDPREYKKFVFVASYWPSNTVYDRINQDEINS